MPRLHRAAAALAAVWLAAAVQPPRSAPSAERIDGVVLDLDLRPVAGAAVTLAPLAGGGGPPPAASDAAGRWSIGGLTPGRWRIRVEAGGFIAASGFVEVGVGAAPLEIRLRPLAEVSPRASEGDPATVLRWLEKGNSLLAQGQTAAARAEYRRALPLLERSERPQVLRAVARTHWLEGAISDAIDALEEAAAADPDDADTRQLLAALLEAAGRDGELEAVLERARRRGAATGAAGALAAPLLPEAPIEAPAPQRRGRYRTRFAEPAPLSGIDIYRQRFGLTAAEIGAVDVAAGSYEPAAESYEVYVPEGPPPPAGWGLLVWVSPTPYGGFASDELRSLLEQRRLIWIGANRSGNGRHSWYRAALALDAAHHLAAAYPVDAGRVWVAGYSGGGRVASSLALLYPEVFRGGLYLYGCNFYRDIPVPDRPGHSWPARFPRPPRERLEKLAVEGRFVLLTGELDFNRSETRRVAEEMRGDGFRHVLYLQVPGASHYDHPGREWLGRALAWLDGEGAAG